MNIEDLKKQYADDCKHSDTPWQWWEYDNTYLKRWHDCSLDNTPAMSFNYEYRRKPDAPVWDKQWNPDNKRLKNGDEFEFLKYYPGQEYPIIGAFKNKSQNCWMASVYKESNFEEIPAPYSHIRKGDPVAVKHGAKCLWYARIFSHADMSGAWVFDDGLFKGGSSNWDECITIEEYKARFGYGNDNN